MTTLVTGATGFLGSQLARRLCADGYDVRVLVRPTSDRRRLAGLPVDVALGDVTDRASIEDALAGTDAVFHVAALYEFGTPDPARMEAINVGGTTNVLEAAAERGVPAVHVSSTAALGPTGADAVDETHWTPEVPASPYAETKRAAHLVARRLAAGGVSVRIAVPATVYGPDDPSMVGMVHGWLARGLVPVGVQAGTVMSLVHVEDCADGLVRIAGRGADGGEYVLAAQTVTFREWFETYTAIAGVRAPVAYVPDVVLRLVGPIAAVARFVPLVPDRLLREAAAMSIGLHWAYSGDRARHEIAWAPRSLEEGLVEVAAWYQHRQAG